MTPVRKNDPKGMQRRIVDACFGFMSRHGYHGSSMQALRDAAEVSSGAFAHHFPTKRALALSVIREGIRPAVEQAWMSPMTEAASAPEGIRAAFVAIADELEANGAVSGCPLNNLSVELSSQDAELRNELNTIFEMWTSAIAHKIRTDVAAGRAVDLDPDRAAIFVVAVYSGAMSIAKAEQTASALRTSLRELQQYFAQFYS